MTIDRDANRMHIVVGSVVQAVEEAPPELQGRLFIVSDKGPYGVTALDIFGGWSTETHILRWNQVVFIGQSEYMPERYALRTATDAEGVNHEPHEDKARQQGGDGRL